MLLGDGPNKALLIGGIVLYDYAHGDRVPLPLRAYNYVWQTQSRMAATRQEWRSGSGMPSLVFHRLPSHQPLR